MSDANAKDYLNRLFNHFEPELQEKIAANATVKTFTKGEVLITPGQYFRSTMLIVEGRVKLYRQGQEGGEFFLYYMEPGSACALSMICAAKQEASQVMAKTVEDTTALLIPIQLMDTLMKNHKSWYYFVLESYRKRYEELLVMIDNIAFNSMDQRLEFYIKQQYAQLGSREIQITHQEIARDLSTSREVISRLLKKMEQQGHLKLHRNHIEYLN